MPDLYVIAAPLSTTLFIWFVGIGIMYGVYWLFIGRKK